VHILETEKVTGACFSAGSSWVVWAVVEGEQASPQVEFKQKKCISLPFWLISGFISPADPVCCVLGWVSFHPDPGRIWRRQ